MSRAVLYVGDALAVLRTLPNASVRCCVTSPPYWGLRDYGDPPQVWGGDPGCRHEWGSPLPPRPGRGNAPGELSTSSLTNPARQDSLPRPATAGAFCGCGAWLGQLGLEPTPELYVEHLVAVFREVRRVLAPDGTLWVNLGDSYATGAGKVGECPGGGEQGERWKGNRGTHDADNSGKHGLSLAAMGPRTQPNRMALPGFKPKDLVGIPWRVAFALQADGWWLRSDIVWAKPNPMPESVTDRPTKAHEYLFLLAKSERYYYDAAAIAERSDNAGRLVRYDGDQKNVAAATDPKMRTRIASNRIVTETRNARSVWTIATQPYPEAHFATFPEELARRCIVAGSAPGDTVLDPFGGSGTVAAVAVGNGRSAVHIDLNPDYNELARHRIGPMLCEDAA